MDFSFILPIVSRLLQLSSTENKFRIMNLVFRIMIVKMTQNLESKMELQINSLETKIEKMQEMFNKDLEEIKKSQLKMNNAMRSKSLWREP